MAYYLWYHNTYRADTLVARFPEKPSDAAIREFMVLDGYDSEEITDEEIALLIKDGTCRMRYLIDLQLDTKGPEDLL